MKPPYLPAAAVTEPHLIRQDLALELHQDLVQQRSGQYQAGGPGVAVARARLVAATTTTGDHENGEEKHGDLGKNRGFSWEKSEVETLLGGYGDFF